MTCSSRPGHRRYRKLRWSGAVLAALLGIGPTVSRAVCGDGTIEGSSLCCPCDCNRDFSVTVDEIVRAVTAALTGGVDCRDEPCFLEGPITVDYIITCINAALTGCPTSSDAGEECDDGGYCIGGQNAGSACTSEDECIGDGACFGGVNDLRGCDGSDDCPGGSCRKCRPYGGDGCAANCTAEADRECLLAPLDTSPPFPVGSRTSILAPVINLPPLPLVGTQVFTTGKVIDAATPFVLKSAGVNLAAIDVSGIACACPRGAEARTCGGTIFDADGAASANCTPGFPGIMECPPDKACAAVHGPGNSGSGFIGCGTSGVDVDVIQDCVGTPGAEPLDPVVTVTENTVPRTAEEGSAQLVITAAIGTVVGRCTGTTTEYGPDGEFCTDDDAVTNRGTPNSILFTTNTASATVFNPGDFEGDILGPITTNGAPFLCTEQGVVMVSGTDLAGAFTACDQPTISDIAVTVNFVCE